MFSLPKIFVDDEENHVENDKHAHGRRILEEINLLGETQRQDEHYQEILTRTINRYPVSFYFFKKHS